jgi:hypothetical protein
MESLGLTYGDSDESSKPDRKRRAASSQTQEGNQCPTEAEDVQQELPPRKKADMDMRAKTLRKSPKLAANCAGDFERKPTFQPGQLVWSQYNEIDGPGLWPATVRTKRGDTITVEWENPGGENPIFIAHCSKLRERPVCGCGNCTALFLTDDNALLEHNKKVTSCANFSDASRNESCRYARERLYLSISFFSLNRLIPGCIGCTSREVMQKKYFGK